MKVTRQELISADPGSVWQFATDVERWPHWMSHINSISRNDSGPFGVGSTATIRQPGLPATVWTVDEFRPDTSFRWWAEFFGMRWSADHVVESAIDGEISLTLSITVTGWPARLLSPLLTRQARKAINTEFDAFRNACQTASDR